MPLGHLESDAFVRFRGSSIIMLSDFKSSPLDFQFYRTSGLKSDTKKVMTSDSDYSVNPTFKYSVTIRIIEQPGRWLLIIAINQHVFFISLIHTREQTFSKPSRLKRPVIVKDWPLSRYISVNSSKGSVNRRIIYFNIELGTFGWRS